MTSSIRILTTTAFFLCSLIGSATAQFEQSDQLATPQRGSFKIRARYFNPFITSGTSRLTVNPFGLPETNGLASRFGQSILDQGPNLSSTSTSPVAETSSAATLTVLPSELPVASSSGRPGYRPPVRSPYRPPPRPGF
ncbi:hypothetical protein [Bythopirellula polymerisocia]|uniref:Uncharacterized protein n=1 Tax=Bythopirellula polymerisocia TaxID=2528003 RepID=A0A5C6CN09_9BACT|nr:hypothetical protein [Bythopirellula polymerisocia]TWU25782.1 hypothetical protein Pla144_29940 [Bythopirellula polymerisocia]